MAMRDSLEVEKIEWHLLPLEVLEPVVQVLMSGREKYGAWNWVSPPYFAKHVVLDSLLRHYVAYTRKGEKIDPESGHLHLAHMACNVLFALYYELNNLWAASEEEMPLLDLPSVEMPGIEEEEEEEEEMAEDATNTPEAPTDEYDAVAAYQAGVDEDKRQRIEAEKQAIIDQITERFTRRIEKPSADVPSTI